MWKKKANRRYQRRGWAAYLCSKTRRPAPRKWRRFSPENFGMLRKLRICERSVTNEPAWRSCGTIFAITCGFDRRPASRSTQTQATPPATRALSDWTQTFGCGKEFGSLKRLEFCRQIRTPRIYRSGGRQWRVFAGVAFTARRFSRRFDPHRRLPSRERGPSRTDFARSRKSVLSVATASDTTRERSRWSCGARHGLEVVCCVPPQTCCSAFFLISSRKGKLE